MADVEDLEQVACEGLIKAAARFDAGLGKDFLSFAVLTVRGDLQRYFRDLGRPSHATRPGDPMGGLLAEADLTVAIGPHPGADGGDGGSWTSTHEEYAEAGSTHGCFAPTSLDRRRRPPKTGAASVT